MAKVIEWMEFEGGTLFWRWSGGAIKRGTRLVVHPGQDAILLQNGKVEGIFEDEGSFEIGPYDGEVLFINTKECTVKWGTKNAINIPAEGLPGGMPIRSFGTFDCRVDEHQTLIDRIAGLQQFGIDDVKERVVAKLDQLLMKWIAAEGKDLFHLQTNAEAISNGIREDLDYEMRKIGIAISGFTISSFTYPEDIQKMVSAQAALSLQRGE